MAVTGKLGTSDSLLGNIELAGGPLSTTPQTYIKNISETLTITETLAFLRVKFANVTESLTLAITLDKNVYFARNISQSLTLSQTNTKTADLNIGITETITLTEAVSPNFYRIRDISETLTLVETPVPGSRRDRNISQTLTLAETIVRGASYARNVTQSLTLVEAQTGVRVFTLNISETLTLTNTAARIRAVVANINETLTINQTNASAGNTFNRTLAQSLSLGITMSAGLPQHYIRNITNTITFYEQLDKLVVKQRNISETLAIGEEAAIREPRTYTNSISETITFVQSLPLLRAVTKNKAESLIIVQAITRGASRKRVTVEDLVIIERPTFVKIKHYNISESFTLSESNSRQRITINSIHETLPLAENMANSGNTFHRNLTEVLPLRNGMYVPTPLSNGVHVFLSGVEVVKVPKTCYVLLQCPQSNSAIMLPCPQMGDSEKNLHQQVIKRSMNNVLYTYIRRNDLQQLGYSFVLGRAVCQNLEWFCSDNIANIITLTNWKGEIWKVYITSSPLDFGGKALFGGEGERWEVNLEFQGVKILG